MDSSWVIRYFVVDEDDSFPAFVGPFAGCEDAGEAPSLFHE